MVCATGTFVSGISSLYRFLDWRAILDYTFSTVRRGNGIIPADLVWLCLLELRRHLNPHVFAGLAIPGGNLSLLGVVDDQACLFCSYTAVVPGLALPTVLMVVRGSPHISKNH